MEYYDKYKKYKCKYKNFKGGSDDSTLTCDPRYYVFWPKSRGGDDKYYPGWIDTIGGLTHFQKKSGLTKKEFKKLIEKADISHEFDKAECLALKNDKEGDNYRLWPKHIEHGDGKYYKDWLVTPATKEQQKHAIDREQYNKMCGIKEENKFKHKICSRNY